MHLKARGNLKAGVKHQNTSEINEIRVPKISLVTLFGASSPEFAAPLKGAAREGETPEICEI